jgi:hypothetical protein
MHANSGYLCATHPDTRRSGHAITANAEAPDSIDDDLLHGADVGHDVPLPFPQVKDRISDNLAGTVIGDIAATVRLMERNTRTPEDILAREQVLHLTVPAKGDDVRVFQQQKLIRYFTSFPLLEQPALELQRFSVADSSELTNFTTTHL